jgi:translation initiation factor IF-3
MRRDSLLPPGCKDIVDTLQSVRVIGKTGSQLGIMTLSAAWSMAESEQADLILIAPSARPPVYRVIDCHTKQKPEPSDEE